MKRCILSLVTPDATAGVKPVLIDNGTGQVVALTAKQRLCITGLVATTTPNLTVTLGSLSLAVIPTGFQNVVFAQEGLLLPAGALPTVTADAVGQITITGTGWILP